MGEQYTVPVAVIVFNRVGLAEKMLKCLEEIKPQKLFVISDGAREDRPGEQEKVENVRALFEQVSWACEIYRNYAEKNMGCDYRVPSGIDWVFDNVEKAIILEDDCIPTKDFFSFASELLNRYEDDPRVMMIAGSNYMQGYSMNDSYCFSSRVYTWGWATWKRAWEHYQNDNDIWEEIKKNGILNQTYKLRIRSFVKKELDYYCDKGKCPWDYLWWMSCMKNKGLCAVPSVNLISNEGFGEDATHTQDPGTYDGRTFPLSFPLSHPKKIERDSKIDKYDKEINRPFLFVRAVRKLKRMLMES